MSLFAFLRKVWEEILALFTAWNLRNSIIQIYTENLHFYFLNKYGGFHLPKITLNLGIFDACR